MPNASTLKEQFPKLIIETLGPLTTAIQGVSAVETLKPNTLVFVTEEKDVAVALASQVACVVTTLNHKKFVEDTPQKAVLFVKNIPLAQALLTTTLVGRFPEHAKNLVGIHPTAVISSKTKIPSSVTVGPYAVIGEDVQIGENAIIGAHVVLENRVKVGARTHLHPHVVVIYDCVIGDDCVLHPHTTIGSEGYGFGHDEKGHAHRIPQLGNVVIENRVELGSHCSVDRATYGSTRIGEGTKTDNYVHFGHNSTVGKNCILAYGFGLAGSSHLGDHVLSGGRTSVTDHVRVASGVRFGGLSAISKDITEPGDYAGYPLQKVRDHLKTTASLPHLPEMRLELARLAEKLKDK